MGNRPEPTALRILKGDTSKGKKPIPTNDLRLKPEIPPMPKFKNKRATAAWKRLVGIMDGMNVITRADAFLMEAFCKTWARYEEANEMADEEGPVHNGDRNAWAITEERSLTAVNRMMGMLGLSPSDRTKIVPIGDTKDELTEYLNQKQQRSG